MQCQESRDWLFLCDDPRPERCDSEAVAAHVCECDACRELAARLAALDAAWRSLPMPAGMETSRAAFLARLPELTAGLTHGAAAPQSVASQSVASRPAGRSQRVSRSQAVLGSRRPWQSIARWATAAAVLIAAGLGLWTTLNVSETQAATQYVDQLIDLNLDLTAAESQRDRQRTYEERAPGLQAALDKHALDPEDREMAKLLLATSATLAASDDPIDQAEQFSQIADKLVKKIKAATRHGNQKELDRHARHYSRVAEGGINGNLKKAKMSSNMNGKRGHRYEHVVQGNMERRRALNSLLKESPKAAAKELRRAFRHAEKATKSTSPQLLLEPDAPFDNVSPTL